ncbi:major facilitator superfamily domain-containing protein [Panaeolus papilionaceus]|nr:major facilitator superfamily domain-containing protein [Panaeolus papilionaceus]
MPSTYDSFVHDRDASDAIFLNRRLDDSRELGARRQAALAEIDNAKFSWFHARVCIVAGIGFFSDAYDIFAISNASVMLGHIYGCKDNLVTLQCSGDFKLRKLDPKLDLALKIATPVGTLVGQVLFGWLADLWGRKKMYGIELMIMIVSTFAQAIAAQGFVIPIIPILIIWRFIMGVGIGGDYPLSAIMASEFASKKIRGRMMVSIFACQGWGYLVSSIVAFVLIYAFKDPLNVPPSLTNKAALENLDRVWRLLIGIGCIPAVVALYFRLTIPETPRFTLDIECNIRQATSDISEAVGDSNRSDLGRLPQVFWEIRKLQGAMWTAYSWFAVDVPYYGILLNTPYLLTSVGLGSIGSKSDSPLFKNLDRACIGNIISAVTLIPGYWVSFYFIDSWGRKPIQILGFTALTILFTIMGATYYHLRPLNHSPGFFVLVCLVNFFNNFGPNVVTFVVPGEAFPTRYRSTCHGISAGMGKIGAIVGQVVISVRQIPKSQPTDGEYLVEDEKLPSGMTATFIIFAVFMASGIASTWFLLPETKRRSLEDLSNENQDFFVMDGFTSSRRIVAQREVGHPS